MRKVLISLFTVFILTGCAASQPKTDGYYDRLTNTEMNKRSPDNHNTHTRFDDGHGREHGRERGDTDAFDAAIGILYLLQLILLPLELIFQ